VIPTAVSWRRHVRCREFSFAGSGETRYVLLVHVAVAVCPWVTFRHDGELRRGEVDRSGGDQRGSADEGEGRSCELHLDGS